MKRLFLTLIMSFSIFNLFGQTKLGFESVDVAEFEKAVADKAYVVLDVRTPEEYREGRVPGSINLPLQEIERITSVVPSKTTPVFLHCRSGKRSGKAEKILKKMGYISVENIGGIINYK